MSKINDLIKELCPNGIEFYKLFEIGEIFTGLSGKSKNDFENGNCRYITYTNIYNNSSVKLNLDDYVKVDDNEKQNDIKYKDILIAGSSENLEDSGMISVVTEEPKENIYLNSFCFGLRLNNDFYNKYNPDFLKHLFRNYAFRNEIVSCSFGVTRYNLSKNKFLKLKIPCPPLEIQEEIVKILDKFGKLEMELMKELEIRKKQYNFLSSKIMKYDINNMKLASICLNITDGSHNPPKETYDSNYYPMISAKNVINGKINFDEGFRKISQEDFIIENKRTKSEIGDVLLTIVGAIGRCAVIESDLKILFQRSICILKPNKNIINSKYLKYIIESSKIQDKIILSANGAAQKGIYLNQINNLLIPVPSLEEQEKIVNILDRFDKLINESIPAEIELRRKQYEYYRNKLLSFEELKKND